MKSGKVITAVDLLLGKGKIGKSVVVMGAGLNRLRNGPAPRSKGHAVTIAGEEGFATTWSGGMLLISLNCLMIIR